MNNKVKALVAALVASSTILPIHAANKDPSLSQPSSSALQGTQMLGQRIAFGELPQQAKKTILQHSGGATPKDVRGLEINGKRYFSANFDQGQTKGRVTVAADGSMVSLRESAVFTADADLQKLQKSQMDFNQLPQLVQQRIRQEAGNARVGNLSQSDVKGQPLYRATFNREGIRHEVFITPQGQLAAEVQAVTVASQVRFDENGNIVANPGQPINEAAGAQAPQHNEPQGNQDIDQQMPK
ncbi:MAG: hypothetical protein JWO95_1352 [Verrucomicrobiales bacterium]|nr:hypothetical protein [Verrucomicrobiales bacterium]